MSGASCNWCALMLLRYSSNLHPQVPPPSTARKWLIVVHIESPQHWTLLEVRWRKRELRFYDSLAAHGSYDLLVKSSVLGLLALCEQLYNCSLHVESWNWIGEQVRRGFYAIHVLTDISSAQRGRRTGTTVAPL